MTMHHSLIQKGSLLSQNLRDSFWNPISYIEYRGLFDSMLKQQQRTNDVMITYEVARQEFAVSYNQVKGVVCKLTLLLFSA